MVLGRGPGSGSGHACRLLTYPLPTLGAEGIGQSPFILPNVPSASQQNPVPAAEAPTAAPVTSKPVKFCVGSAACLPTQAWARRRCSFLLPACPGIGKSTLLSLIGGTLEPVEGQITRNPRTRFATFSQHHVDGLDLALNPLQYMCRCFAHTPEQELR